MQHFRFTINNGTDIVPVDVMKDTLQHAIDLMVNFYGPDSILSIESVLYCPPGNRRGATKQVVENSRFTSRPGCGIQHPWDNNIQDSAFMDDNYGG